MEIILAVDNGTMNTKSHKHPLSLSLTHTLHWMGFAFGDNNVE